MSPGGLRSTGTGASPPAADGDEDGVDEPVTECAADVADAGGLAGGVVDMADAGGLAGGVVDVVAEQAATPITRTATPSATTPWRIDTRARYIFMTPQCNHHHESTMRAQAP